MTQDYTMRRITADDAVADLLDWVNGADIEALADLYSKVVANDSDEAEDTE
jgi:hypothetical protein